MNDRRKLGSKTSAELPHTKRRPTSTHGHRNPLKDLNNNGNDAPSRDHRRCCLTSSSSSSSRPRSQPKTPQSAPPLPKNQLSTKSKPDPPNPRSKHPVKQASLERPRNIEHLRARGSNSLKAAQRLNPVSSARGRVVPKAMPSSLRSGRNGHREVASMDGRIGRGNREMGCGERCDLGEVPMLQSTPEKEGGDQPKELFQVREGVATTPPIQSSISPEFACGQLPTPACFAAGYLIAGVPDRRKCRPRGMLKVGDDCKLVEIGETSCSESANLRRDGSGDTCNTPPLVKASIQWLASPFRNANQIYGSRSGHGLELGGDYSDDVSGNGADVPGNGAFSPCENVNFIASPSPSSDVGTENLSGLDCLDFWKTPSTNSSVSSFSMILKKATTFSGVGAISPGSEIRKLPCSLQLSGETSALCTPSRSSSSMQHCPLPTCEEEFMGEIVKIPVSSSPEWCGNSHSVSKLPPSSFQFGCAALSSESVDLEKFRKSPCFADTASERMQTEGGTVPDSSMRISWREGLVSRIFQTRKLDDNDQSDLLDANGDSESISADNRGGNGFGSIEYLSYPHVDRQRYAEDLLPEVVKFPDLTIVNLELLQ